MNLKLVIANKNYSSWSMRPWVLLTQAGIPFEEVQLKFTDAGDVGGYRGMVADAARSRFCGSTINRYGTPLPSARPRPNSSPPNSFGRRTLLRAGWPALSAQKCTRASASCAGTCR